jgi:hypothetical protein
VNIKIVFSRIISLFLEKKTEQKRIIKMESSDCCGKEKNGFENGVKK